MPTDLAFLHDAYARTFATVVSDVETGDDHVRVALDTTLFYPTGGGQPHDLGVLRWDGGSARVSGVRKQGDEVWHTLEGGNAGSLPAAGTPVHGEIDWRRRYDNMQQHTGQHLLSAVLDDLLRLRTVSVHFGDETSLVEYLHRYGRGAELSLNDFSSGRWESALDAAWQAPHPEATPPASGVTKAADLLARYLS